MKILVIGGGGREHALVWKLAQSKRRPALYCAPGNGGTATPADNVDIASGEIERLYEFARSERIDLTIVGPEEPLCAGIVDRFEAAGLRIFGPRAAAARIEGDKAWAKQLMRAAGVPTAEGRVFAPGEQEKAARRYPQQMDGRDAPTRVVRAYDLARDYVATRDGGVVVKASGLAKGKGVYVCDDSAAALVALEKLMAQRLLGEAGDTVVVEERLNGTEISMLAFVDGRNIYILEGARDYKRLGDGDAGPNTGGMGAYSPTANLTDAQMRQIESEVFVPIVDAMQREGIVYRGVLYAGLMLTPGGPKVLEFNARLGDPETQPLLMRLKTDLIDIIEATLDDRLDQITLEWDPRAAVCVVAASEGYPDDSRLGLTIEGLSDATRVPDTVVFHGGTRRDGKRVLTTGGRVLGVTALGPTMAGARERAYEALGLISFDGMQYRRDIASGVA